MSRLPNKSIVKRNTKVEDDAPLEGSFRLSVHIMTNSSPTDSAKWKTSTSKSAPKQVLAVTKVGTEKIFPAIFKDFEQRNVKTSERKCPSFYSHYLAISCQNNPLKEVLVNKGFRTKEERNLMAFSKHLLKKKRPCEEKEIVVKVIDITKPINLRSRYTNKTKPLSVNIGVK